MRLFRTVRSGQRRLVTGGGLACLVLVAAGCLPVLDSEFGGGDGVVVIDAPSEWSGEWPNTVVGQPDGKTLVLWSDGGESAYGGLHLTRLNPDGGSDATFGSGGRVDLGVDGVGWCSDLVVQADGRLLVSTQDNTSITDEPEIVRFFPDGTRDLTFGTDGGARLPVSDDWSKPCDLAVQPDGKIVATADLEASGSLEIARWLPDGSVDTAFGENGIATKYVWPPSPTGMMEYATALALQPDGKIVVVGGGVDSTRDHPPHTPIARFTSSGLPDHSFANQGGLYEALGGEAVDVAVRPNGRILVTGTTLTDDGARIFLAQFDSAGGRDRAFGTDGVTRAGSDVDAEAMILLDDGRVVVAGGEWITFHDPFHNDGFTLVRFLVDGQLDDSFGADGISTTDRYAGDERALEIAVQTDGKLLVAGSVPGQQATSRDIAVYRYRA